jgi:hypothetical protein
LTKRYNTGLRALLVAIITDVQGSDTTMYNQGTLAGNIKKETVTITATVPSKAS